MSDLEDNVDDQYADDVAQDQADDVDAQRMKAELFGDENDDEDYQEPQGPEEEEYRDDLGDDMEAAPGPGSDAERPASEQRAGSKRHTTDEDEDYEEQGKPKKKREGDKVKGSKGEKRDKLRKRRLSTRSTAGQTAEDGQQGGRRAPAGPIPNTEDAHETDADRNFIDDEGVAEEDQYLEDGVPLLAPEAEEAAEGEEEGEFEKMIGKNKRRKNKESDSEMAMIVDDKVAKMEAAAEEDMEQHEAGRPAVQKLKMLLEAEQFLAQKKYHEMFISAGGLGVIKAWLEPYSDGSLPNVKVRSAMLQACKNLPIDTSREDIKGSLKKSQLGSRVMFLAKCPDETTSNRALARELVQKWSRPIFFDSELEAEKKHQREEQLKRARLQALEVQRAQEALQPETQKQQAKLRPGQAGYRWHASIPQASKLDYVVEPARDDRVAAAVAAVGTGGGKDKDSRFSKKMRDVLRKQKGKTARAALPSVEGRGIVVMNH